MLETVPDTISFSQRRPREIAPTSRARRSMRVGRTSLREAPMGTRICRDFLDGGHLDDFNIRPQFMLTHDLAVSGFLQYEHWFFPLLSASGHSNTTAQLQLTFFPHLRVRR